MLGWLIGLGILAFALYWLAVNILIPLSLLNLSLIFSVIAWRSTTRRTLMAVFAVVGGCFLLLDLSNGWFSQSFLRNILKERRWLDLIVYVNSAAVGLSAWFLASPLWRNAGALPVSENVRKIMMRLSTIGIVVISAAAIPFLYNKDRMESGISTKEFNGKSVQIGEQVWMAENLDVTTFRNGDPIPEAKTDEEWEEVGKKGEPAWCHIGNDVSVGVDFGKLYNWHAVNDPRGLAPEGWHIPNDDDWTKLIKFLGGSKTAGVKLKSSTYWNDVKRSGGNGDNSSGFNGIPSGNRNSDGELANGTYLAFWWTSSEDRDGKVWTRKLNYEHHHVLRESYSKSMGFTVRCIKDTKADSSIAASTGTKEEKGKSSDSAPKIDWRGTYTHYMQEQLISHTLKIDGKGGCTLQGEGVQTYFTLRCKTRRNGEALEIYYTKTLEGGFSSDWIDSNLPILTLYYKDGLLYTDEGQMNKQVKGGQLLFKKEVD